MLDRFKIMFLGYQPIARVTKKTLDRIIRRDYPNNFEEVKQKLESIKSDSNKGRYRLSASVLKLTNRDLTKIEEYIKLCNVDYRDIIAKAEYPGSSKSDFVGLDNISTKQMKEQYLDDWIEYQTWIKNK